MSSPFKLPDFYLPWPVRLNPLVDLTRAHNRAWADRMGMLDAGVWGRSAFDAADYALLAGYTFPDAFGPMLDLATDWYVWAFFLDDWFLQCYKQTRDPAGAAEYVAQATHFMPIELGKPLPEPADPVQRGLVDLWARSRHLMSPGLRRRFVEHTFAQLTDALWELDNINDNRVPNPVEYLEHRRGTVAGQWIADMVEMVASAELPEAVVGTRPIRVLRDTFGDAGLLRNDLFSYQREIEEEGEVNNSVLVLQHFLDMNPQQAADTVNDLITSRMQQFENTVLTELPLLFDECLLSPAERLNIVRYAKGLQDWQAGWHAWMLQSPRYSDAGNPAAAWLGPRGLGTAAARLWASYRPVDRTPRPFTMPELASRFPARVNPQLRAARSAAKAWAARMGMLDGTVWDQKSFDAADFAAWVAHTHPDAPALRLETVSKWYVWASYLDDVVDTVFKPRRDLLGAKVYLSRLAEFLPADPADMPAPTNPSERGLADLWPATAPDMTDRLRQVFPQHIQDWIDGAMWALAAIVQQRVPDPVDYLEMRRQTGGAGFSLDLLQHALSIELPAAVAALPLLSRLNNIFADNMGWYHDIRSYPKEIETEGEIANGVLVLQRFFGCDLQQAVNIVRDLLQVRQLQFDRLAAAAALAGPDACPMLRRYVTGMRYWMGGDWSWATQHYQRVDSAPPVTVEPCAGARDVLRPTGLGTSAARLIPARVG